ncbi:MAG: phosphatase PAP2 family protein [Elusimicrobiota bacterium]|jgi:membrane-associated phospholipid phosphatase|nr:phosphatase PAP2 family protein [Elusimicrobiota bacterium]
MNYKALLDYKYLINLAHAVIAFIVCSFLVGDTIFYENVFLEPISTYDQKLFLFINNSHYKILDYPMMFLTYLDSTGLNISIIILFIFCAIALKHYHPKNFLILFALLLLALLFSSFVSHLIKEYIHRPRPMAVFSIFDVKSFYEYGIKNSFPSGHSISAFSMCFFVFLVLKKYRIFFLVLAIFVGFERIYVGMHFPFDVLIGALMGIVAANIMVNIAKKIGAV